MFFSDSWIVGIKIEGSHTTGNDSVGKKKKVAFRKCKEGGPILSGVDRSFLKHFSFTFFCFLSPLTPSPPALCISPWLLPFLIPSLASPLPTALLHPLLIPYHPSPVPHPPQDCFPSWILHLSSSYLQRFQGKCVFRNKNQEHRRIKKSKDTKKGFFEFKSHFGKWEGED